MSLHRPIVAYWVRGADYQELADLSAQSVRKVHPNADIRIITDDGSRPAMVANLDAQLSVIWKAQRGAPILFLDVDTLIRKPFPFGEADLTVTWRDHVGYTNGEKVSGVAELMPFNYGVLGVRAYERTYEAFQWMRAQVLKMSPQHQAWYGNQLALAALVGSHPESGERDSEARARWSLTDTGTLLKVKQLPCEVWNYTPASDSENVREKGLLHFKGNRKDWMAHYARCA